MIIQIHTTQGTFNVDSQTVTDDQLEAWGITREELFPPPLCTHWAQVLSFHPSTIKPVRVHRDWCAETYQVDCFATQATVDHFTSANLSPGDFVLVHFLEDDPQLAIVFAKVFKTW